MKRKQSRRRKKMVKDRNHNDFDIGTSNIRFYL